MLIKWQRTGTYIDPFAVAHIFKAPPPNLNQAVVMIGTTALGVPFSASETVETIAAEINTLRAALSDGTAALPSPDFKPKLIRDPGARPQNGDN